MAQKKLSDLPAFALSAANTIPAVNQDLIRTFVSHKTRPIEYRLKQLKSLYWALKDAADAIAEACQLDLHKSSYETHMTETGWVMNDVLFMVDNLARFMKDEKAEDISLTNLPMSPRIRKDPLGAVLIIGAYNFPVQLSLGPLVGAIAAGCTAVLKPSENAPNVARVLQHIIETSLDSSAYKCVQGAVPETTALLDCKWDKIFYTGGAMVGRIIAKKAAETLTPVTLELGGVNPAIVTRSADPRLAARRLLWAKLMNAGQVCVSQNYILVDKEILPQLLKEIEVALKEFHPNGSEGNADYSHIVNERQWQRLKKMLDSTKGKIVHGGRTDKSNFFFEPTVVLVDSVEDPLLRDESFGPLIPILAVQDLDEAIRYANSLDETPLGVYAFGSRKDTDKVLAQTRSGGASVNDGFFHASVPTLAFGGVGGSGQGSYRGKASFDCFTHRRSVTSTPGWIEGLMDIRYPPYTPAKFKKMKLMIDKKPSFDRNGRATGGWLWYALTLGGKSPLYAAGRWLIVGAIAVYLGLYQKRKSESLV